MIAINISLYIKSHKMKINEMSYINILKLV